MKVLLQIRPDAFSRFGGDTQQLVKTREALQSLGVTAEISLSLRPDAGKYDLVHLFNISRVHDTYVQCRNASGQGKPVVLSPIYQSRRLLGEYYEFQFSGMPLFLTRSLGYDRIQCLKGLADALRTPSLWRSAMVQCGKGYRSEQKDVVRNASMLLVNSEQEAAAMRRELSCELPAVRIVPNAVETEDQISLADPGSFTAAEGLRGYVLYPGRIEPLKNQLGFLDAIEGLHMPVIFAGALSVRHRGYCRRFLRRIAARPETRWVDKVDRRQLFAACAAAKVVALASWFETTGLVGLEGGITGANIVITSRGYTREYYHDDAWYCDPADRHSVRNAVESAFSAARGERPLAARIRRSNLTWENAGRLTLDAYTSVLSRTAT